MQKWEYRIVSETFNLNLDDLGNDGWELVAVQQSRPEYQARLWFKRPIPAKPKRPEATK